MTISHEGIRAELPVLDQQAYLNTGSAGPVPRRAAAAIHNELDRQLTHGRADFRVFMEEHIPMLGSLRAGFARLLGADTDEVALTHHTTDGMNIAVWGINWRPGDEIVTTNLEHEGVIFPVYAAAQRYGLTVRVVDLRQAGAEPARDLAAALTPRTRLVVLSHVSFCTGEILPIAEIAAAAREFGALVAVDGAQSAGAIPVDVRKLGVDIYAVSGQKWLCGPEGVGALYVRSDRLSQLTPTYVGYFSVKSFESWDYAGRFMPASDASRYETSTLFWPALYGMLESLAWLEEITHDQIYRAGQAITRRCREILADLPGTDLLTPEDHAGLTTFRVEGLDPESAAIALSRQDVVIRWIREPFSLRVSTGFFNNESDLQRLREGLLDLLR